MGWNDLRRLMASSPGSPQSPRALDEIDCGIHHRFTVQRAGRFQSQKTWEERWSRYGDRVYEAMNSLCMILAMT
jgi:hypothetical protein